MTTLIIDVGQDIAGVSPGEEWNYIPYRGDAISSAIQRIQTADEVVTYSGFDFVDLMELGKFVGLSLGQTLPLKGMHTDMSRICWPGIIGSSLRNTHFRSFPRPSLFPGRGGRLRARQ